MEAETEPAYEGPEPDELSGWNCLLTILGINLMMFVIATYVARCW